ncbi:MAG: 16S rRNA (cytosine(967)-C(5))-methyltransferase RsmB [Deltaproteobacteria bacterium]|nr:16S rRNA (cytosine(967)-C(5))-methyltransferase RsmB [Deltaproteobacteria bacterium]
MNARQAAHAVLNKVSSGGYADALLASVLPSVAPIDRALATEITYGALRHRSRLDWIIDSFSAIKTGKLEHAVANALRIGLYQLYLLDNIPVCAAINESVNLVKSGGPKKAGFVNAVLRKAASNKGGVVYPSLETDPLGHISVFRSNPVWLTRRWIARFGVADAEALCAANLAAPPRALRVNTLLLTRPELLDELKKNGVEAKATEFSPDGVEVTDGAIEPFDPRWHVQDQGSQLIAHLIGPRSGERLLDACAAPGGKTTHIAALMKNAGEVWAVDKDDKRRAVVNETAKRLGSSIVKTMKADAASPGLFDRLSGLFDGVLCDAPCSGLGVARRTPDIKWRRTEKDVRTLADAQKRLLKNLAGCVLPGGRLVYSVCTFEPEETDAVVEEFLKTRAGFTLEDARGFLPASCASLVDDSGRLRTYPHRHGMDGFFGARFKKKD